MSEAYRREMHDALCAHTRKITELLDGVLKAKAKAEAEQPPEPESDRVRIVWAGHDCRVEIFALKQWHSVHEEVMPRDAADADAGTLRTFCGELREEGRVAGLEEARKCADELSCCSALLLSEHEPVWWLLHVRNKIEDLKSKPKEEK